MFLVCSQPPQREEFPISHLFKIPTQQHTPPPPHHGMRGEHYTLSRITELRDWSIKKFLQFPAHSF